MPDLFEEHTELRLSVRKGNSTISITKLVSETELGQAVDPLAIVGYQLDIMKKTVLGAIFNEE